MTNVELLYREKYNQLGKLIEAIMYKSSIVKCLAIDGPATIAAGFENENYIIIDEKTGNKIGFTYNEALLLQDLAQGCNHFRDFAAKFPDESVLEAA